MKIAITGATGQLGRLAIAALKERTDAANVVALVRSLQKAADLGIEARAADYTEPHSLPATLEGVDVLVLISSSDFNDRHGQHANVINAARKAGVSRMVYTSILKGDASPMELATDHIATEKTIADSGLESTLLRNGWYTENFTGSLGGALEAGAMIGSAGTGRISGAARADYAEAIAVTASQPGHERKVYELAGDYAFTMAEMAAEVSRIAGRNIQYNSLPTAQYASILQSFGLPAGLAALLANSDECAAHGALLDESRTLSTLIGRPTTPMADTVAKALAA